MSQVHTSLEARARKIVEALGGTWSRSRGMCCCPAHADRTPSLSITLGKRAILVHCFAGCANEAVIEGMAKLGVRISDLFDGPGGGHASEPRKEVADRNALRLWREAAILASSPAARYLSARGITISSSDLRFHPRMPLGPKARCGSCRLWWQRYATTLAYWLCTEPSSIPTVTVSPHSHSPSARWAAPARVPSAWLTRNVAALVLPRGTSPRSRRCSCSVFPAGPRLAMSGSAWSQSRIGARVAFVRRQRRRRSARRGARQRSLCLRRPADRHPAARTT